mmetsp:Transcript_21123/g.39634  ORF Transcript_21123/g.39634 Transcript_21123/m.39634 type:complete len:360 (-) Transcript_21123:1292-2371(-)
MPDNLRLEHLNALVNLVAVNLLLAALVSVLLEVGCNLAVEVLVSDAGTVEAGEEIVDEAEEKRDVLENVLGHVGITQNTHEHKILGHLGELALKSSSHDQNGLHGTESEIVVVLLGELLPGKLVKHDHLLGQTLRFVEALGEKHVLGDLLEIGDNHGDGAEERLQVIGQLCAAGVSGVHGDEDSGRGEAVDALDGHGGSSSDVDSRRLVDQGILNGLELGGNDGEHLNVDSVELVEAAPGSGLHEAAEGGSHGLVIKALSTVNDEARKGETLGEILDGLGLSGSGRAGRTTSELEGESLGEGHVATVGQGGDDQTAVQAHVLVSVPEGTRALLDDAVVLVLVPVKSELGLPLELLGVQY